MVYDTGKFDAAKLQPWRSSTVTHSGRTVVLLGKFKDPRLKSQIPRIHIPIYD